MTMKVSDEMLMAYVDGELDAETAEDVRRQTAGDRELAQRAEQFRTVRQMTRDAFAGVRAEPVPERLVAAVLKGGPSSANVVSFEPRRKLPPSWLALAASIAVIVGLGGYWMGQNVVPQGDLLGGRMLAEALGETQSGEERLFRIGSQDGRLAVLDAYRVQGGLCRTFEIRGAGLDGDVRGVGCNFGADWHVDIAVASHGEGDGYAPASSGALGSLDAYLDALGAEGPLSPEEEAAAVRE